MRIRARLVSRQLNIIGVSIGKLGEFSVNTRERTLSIDSAACAGTNHF